MQEVRVGCDMCTPGSGLTTGAGPILPFEFTLCLMEDVPVERLVN